MVFPLQPARVLVLFAALPALGALAGEPVKPQTIRFNDHIRPIFTKHCTACHGGVKQAGDLSFSYRDKVLPPDGWVVEPGDPESSILMERVLAEAEDEVMPPPEHGPRLSEHEVALLRQWIKQGASWSEHWAFETPRQPSLPKVVDPSWCRQQMDHFVLAALEAKHIRPATDEAPLRWLRRVSLDLTGLPPTIEQRESFLKQVETEGEQAYANAVDELLQSEHFGERWASTWLDQVRYADSKGLGLDARRQIWKYRDWVINALNSDMAYDTFTIKQIAGDLLPNSSIDDRLATAVHRLTQTNEEGGTDDEEFRVAAVLDRVNTTWQTWQGVTFGCVQCHSHPYDPFEQDEYYKFAAFFNNTTDSDLNEDWPILKAPVNRDDYERASTLDQEIAELRDQLWTEESKLLVDDAIWEPLVDVTAKSSNATKLRVDRVGEHDEFSTVGTITSGLGISLTAPVPSRLKSVSAFKVTIKPLDPDVAVSDSEWGFVLSHVEAKLVNAEKTEAKPLEIKRVIIDEPNPNHDPQQSLNEKSKEGFSAYTRIHYPRRAAFILNEAVSIPEGSIIQVKLKHKVFILASFALVSRRGHVALTDDPRLLELQSNPERKTLQEKLAKLKKERSGIKSANVPVLRQRPSHLQRPTHVFVRGLFLTKDKEVQPGTPKSLPALDDSDGPPNRLTLARWIASDKNPLTARVAVNRLWARLFGQGLVSTEEDFGSSGETPSHPKLLDHLAVRFQSEYDWSVKKVLREIVLSSTYRQDSRYRDDVGELDPDNRWLARGPRHRLPAETLRDQALALSGLLDRTLHGPPVHPPIPSGVWQPFASDKWETPKPDQSGRYRRSIYTYTKRSIPFPMFAAFDMPSREFCTPRRLRSNTPLQALMTLNDETFHECSEALGKQMIEKGETPQQQIAAGFELVVCRKPDQWEVDKLVAMHERISEAGGQSPMTNVAAVLLNLDEVLTK